MPRQQNVKPENYNKSLPSRLRALLEEKSLRPEDIAKATGSTRQSINYYKNGDRVPDADMLAKISKYLGVSSDYLLGLSDTKSLDESIQAAAKLTGLSGDAIEILKILNDNKIQKPLKMLDLLMYDTGQRIGLVLNTNLHNHMDTLMLGSILSQMYDYVSVMADNHLRVEFQSANDRKTLSEVLAVLTGDSIPNNVIVSRNDISDAYIFTKERKMITAISMLTSRLLQLRDLEGNNGNNTDEKE